MDRQQSASQPVWNHDWVHIDSYVTHMDQQEEQMLKQSIFINYYLSLKKGEHK